MPSTDRYEVETVSQPCNIIFLQLEPGRCALILEKRVNEKTFILLKFSFTGFISSGQNFASGFIFCLVRFF